MSMFEDVATMNVAYGNSKGDPLTPDWERLKSQAKNIGDEFRELMEDGIEAKNITEVRDAICDILVFTLGLGHMAGVPVESDMAAVYKSNMSKFCKNTDELIDTVAKYHSLGVVVYSEGDFPMVRVKSARDQTDKNGKADYRAGKMLKCVKYEEPVFAPLNFVSPSGRDLVAGLAFVPELNGLHG